MAYLLIGRLLTPIAKCASSYNLTSKYINGCKDSLICLKDIIWFVAFLFDNTYLYLLTLMILFDAIKMKSFRDIAF